MKNFKPFCKPFLSSKLFFGCMMMLCISLVPILCSNPYFLRLVVLTFIFSILAMSLNLLLGFTGIISLGHATFFGIGAYTTGILSTKLGLPFWVILPVSAGVPVIVAILFGLLTLKSLKELYFGLASWGLGEIIYAVYVNTEYLGGTNGVRGIPEPALLGFSISSDLSFYYLTLVFAIFTYLSLELLLLSRIGRAWVAVRESPVVAGVMGVNVLIFQLISLSVSAFYAGIAGTLFAYYETYISPGTFNIWESIVIICMVLVGGRRSLPGSALGAAIFTFLPELLRPIGEYRMIVYGFILLLTILFKPKGLISPYFLLKRSEEE
jgi:branched-chain amino acid transport system permease protein